MPDGGPAKQQGKRRSKSLKKMKKYSAKTFVKAFVLGTGTFAAGFLPAVGHAITLRETPYFAKQVAAGELPPVAKRAPVVPSIVKFDGKSKVIGKQGGELSTLIGRAKDVRLLVVYGYSRLVAYDENFQLQPDILQSYEVKDGRQFTFKLRPGHKWSDGKPFTARDFYYWWTYVANDKRLSPAGPPREMLVDGKPPKFEVLDDYTVRYTWDKPNPFFLPRLAGASPLFIYRPAHYLKKFHVDFADPKTLQAALEKGHTRNWAALHNRQDNMYRFDNPNLPTLQPWINTSRPPTTRFVATRNPYYYRFDEKGQQLPYFDRFSLSVADGKLIPAKAGTGEVDIQARHIAFNNYTFLKEHETQGHFKTYLWRIAKGSQMALFPNLNIKDPAWRKLFRDVRFRRALSMAIDRDSINEVLFFGLAIPSNNTVLPNSPLFKEEYQKKWAEFDIDAANDLLDQIGLTKRNDDDIRLLPDGRPLEIVVETAGESSEQVDILELINETWRQIGVKLFIKPSQREVFRNRIFSGETQISVWFGLENGIANEEVLPNELAPTSQQQLQWPMWGQYYETSGLNGEKPDMPKAVELLQLEKQWLGTNDRAEKAKIWHKMLAINANQVFSIGTVSGVKQPVVVKDGVMNVPQKAIYNWDPGAQFGVYRPDTFWRQSK